MGFTVWLTGLSGAGKTTLAKLLAAELPGDVRLLDGDVWRQALGRDLGFSKEDRDENVRRAGLVAAYLANTGSSVIASFISPYAEARQRALAWHERFLLVHVACPLEVCEERDVKGLYAQARAGKLNGFTGIDDPYHEPAQPDLTVWTDGCSPADGCREIVGELRKRGWLSDLASPAWGELTPDCNG